MNSITRIDSPLASPDLNQQLQQIAPPVADILRRALAGETLSRVDSVTLFNCRGPELQAVLNCADRVRQLRCGDTGTFVITRNINFTNVCYMGCRFCNFARKREDSDAEFLSLEEIANRAEEAWQRGATEVCVQGGLHPDITPDYYRNLLIAIKQRVPDIHIHAFSPFEIWYGAKKARMTPVEFLKDLKAHGLGSMPGTAAEILDTEIRSQLTRNKLTTDNWVEIVRAAHSVGIRTTATIMYGHIDGPEHWADHLLLLRQIQQETGGFTEFVPLGFIHYETALYNDNPDTVRPGPTHKEHLLMHAVARLVLQGQIDNIQASWVKMGPDVASQMLRAGANDLGGTLMNESISRAAGGQHGQEVTPQDMIDQIHRAGFEASQRSTLYGSHNRYPLPEEHPAAQFYTPAQQIAVAGGAA